jgi:hypothetical protein
MRFAGWRSLALIVFLAAPGVGLAADADTDGGATLAGTFRDWFVYRAGDEGNPLCYALSQPRSSDPGNVQRGQIAFLVSTWPAQGKHHEPSIVPGYPYREGEDSSVRVQIGGDQFEFGLVRNEGDEGGAWMEDAAQETRLINSMKNGNNMVVTGTSARGTLTHDTYSLAGITAALDAIDELCN